MRIFLLAAGIVILCFTGSVNALDPYIEWTATVGGNSSDEGYSVRQTTDGGYVLTGLTVSFGSGNADIYLVRTDAGGDTLWTTTFGGASDDWGECVNQTTDGGFIISGVTGSCGAGSRDIYLVKTDDAGNTEWTGTLGGIDDDESYAVQQTNDDGYIITGYTRSFGSGSEDVYLIKTSSSGDTLWTRTFGGAESDIGAFVQQTADGGYIVAGSTESSGAGGSDVYLIKTDSTGETMWSRTIGGPESDSAYYVQQTDDGGYIVAGYTRSYGAGNNDVYLVKTDSEGNTLWARTFGGSANDTGESVQQTDDSGYIITGFTYSSGAGSSDVYLIKTGSDGDPIWTTTIGGPQYDRCNSIQQTMDGGCIVGGLTLSYGSGSSDVYLIKLGPDTGIEEEAIEPSPVTLAPACPNPFTSELNITYSIPEQTRVQLAILDLSGRLVEILVSGLLSSGSHTAEWTPAPGTPGGCYLVRLDACGYCKIDKCLKLD